MEINGFWVRSLNAFHPAYISRRFALRRRTELSVNVGCGVCGTPGWVNLDLMPLKGLTLRYDCRKSLPLAPRSARRIRCEHFFEHLDPVEDVPLFLAACRKALAPGGVLRIVVPDVEKFAGAYISRSREIWHELGWDLDNLPAGVFTAMDVLNHVFRQGTDHQYAYDFETLAHRLTAAGFSRVQRMAFRDSLDAELTRDQENHKGYSLYVDAVN